MQSTAQTIATDTGLANPSFMVVGPHVKRILARCNGNDAVHAALTLLFPCLPWYEQDDYVYTPYIPVMVYPSHNGVGVSCI